MKKSKLKHIWGYRFSKSTKGSTLIEAIIALSAIVIVLAATSSLVITSLNNSTFSKDQGQANKLAQQGVEYIRDQVSSKDGFDTYIGYIDPITQTSTVRCMPDINSPDPIWDLVCDSNQGEAFIDQAFIREVVFSNSPDCNAPEVGSKDTLKATVTVYWQSGKCTTDNPFCHSQQVTSCFTDPGNTTIGI